MKPDVFPPDIQEFLRLLAKHSVRFLIVGCTAVIYHGYARLTGDFDFFYDRTVENVDRLWSALLEFWNGSVPTLQRADELLEPGIVVQFGRPPNRIDLLSSIGGAAFSEAWSRREEDVIETPRGRVPIFLLGLEDLRRSKQAAGRPKDLDDLAHLPEARPSE